MDRICTAKLAEQYKVRPFCTCPNCREREKAIDFYHRDLCPGPAVSEPFPEKEGPQDARD